MALIKLIKALAEKIEALSDDVVDLKSKAEPLIENTSNFLKTANRVATSIDNNMDTLTETVNTVKETVTKVTDLVDTVREKVQPPVLETLASYNGIVKGVKVFFDAIKDRTNMFSSRKGNNVDVDFDLNIDVDYDKSYSNKQKKSRQTLDTEFSELDNINAELNDLRKKIQEQDL